MLVGLQPSGEAFHLPFSCPHLDSALLVNLGFTAFCRILLHTLFRRYHSVNFKFYFA